IGAMILHHTRKMESDDPIDSVSGTLGLTGCVDTVSVLARTPKGTTLYIRGRDVAEQEKAVAFSKTTCRWTIMGDAEEVHQSDTRRRLGQVLEDASEALSPDAIGHQADIGRANVDKTLARMVASAEIIKVSRGLYVHPNRKDLLSLYPCQKRQKSERPRN